MIEVSKGTYYRIHVPPSIWSSKVKCLAHVLRHSQHVYWTVAKTWSFSTRDWQSCPLVKTFCKLVSSHLPWFQNHHRFLWPDAGVPILVQLRVFHFLFWSFHGIFKLFVFLVLCQPVAPCAYSQCHQGLIHTGSKAYLSCSFQLIWSPLSITVQAVHSTLSSLTI